MGLVAWLVVGAVAGYVAGLFVDADEGLGVIGHIILGIVGAMVGGFLASALLGINDPITSPIDVESVAIAGVGSILTVIVVNAFTGDRSVRV